MKGARKRGERGRGGESRQQQQIIPNPKPFFFIRAIFVFGHKNKVDHFWRFSLDLNFDLSKLKGKELEEEEEG